MLEERWLACAGVDLATGLPNGASSSASAAESACACNETLVAAVGQSSSLVLDARLTNVTLSGLAPFTCYAFAIDPQNEFGLQSDANHTSWLMINTPAVGTLIWIYS